MELAARKGFHTLGLTYLRQLAKHCECDALSSPLCETIDALCKTYVLKYKDVVLQEALKRRGVSYEHGSDDLGRAVAFEFILDLFSGDDAKLLEQEIKSAKADKQERAAFYQEYAAYKVFLQSFALGQ